MEYVCDHMKRIVIYDQDTISITLERCGECIGCLRSKAETPLHSCEALEEIGKILCQPGFETAKIIIEGLREK